MLSRPITKNDFVLFLLCLVKLARSIQGVRIESLILEYLVPGSFVADEWPEIAGLSSEERKELIDGLGNFIELSRGTNSSVSNSSFGSKQEEYKVVNPQDPLSGSSVSVLAVHDWSAEVVERRTKVLAEEIQDFLKNGI
jgi:hypothetical protein